MATDEGMSLEKARRIIGVDRLILIGLLSLLIEKDIIGESDLVSLRIRCEKILKGMQVANDPIFQIHSEEVASELNHLLSSFRNKR
jgi:hypothetical protein